MSLLHSMQKCAIKSDVNQGCVAVQAGWVEMKQEEKDAFFCNSVPYCVIVLLKKFQMFLHKTVQQALMELAGEAQIWQLRL